MPGWQSIASRIVSSTRNWANDRTTSSIFLFRITLAAIISSNHSYRYLSPTFFPWRHVTCVILTFLKISRTTSDLTSEANCKFTTFFNIANPLILCAPPQIFIVPERSRSDLAKQLWNIPEQREFFNSRSAELIKIVQARRRLLLLSKTMRVVFEVARTYLYGRWLYFWIAIFGRNDLTDFHDFWHP